jgi:hypothetical protein
MSGNCMLAGMHRCAGDVVPRTLMSSGVMLQWDNCASLTVDDDQLTLSRFVDQVKVCGADAFTYPVKGKISRST